MTHTHVRARMRDCVESKTHQSPRHEHTLRGGVDVITYDDIPTMVVAKGSVTRGEPLR